MRIIITITIIVIIHHSMLDLLRIKFYCFIIYDISDLASRVTGLKNLRGLISSFIFYFIYIFYFYCLTLIF
jgi:hypothetical protein